MKYLIYTYRNLNHLKRHMSGLTYHNSNVKNISNDVFFKHKKLERVAHKFVKIPIHYQKPKELNATIVSGGNAFLKNVNFWKRCESATLRLFDCFTPSDLVHILNGFAKGNYFSAILFNKIGHILSESIDDIKIEHFHAILLAYSTANIYIPNLIKAIERRISNEYSLINPSTLSLYLTTCDLFNYTLNKNTIDSLLPYLSTYSGSFPPEDYCRAVYGLIRYIQSYPNYLESLQENMIPNIPNIPISLLMTLCRKLSNLPPNMISKKLVIKINEYSLEKTPLIAPSEIPCLLRSIHCINRLIKIDSSITLNSMINHLIRQYNEIDCYGILTAYAITQDFGLDNHYLTQLVNTFAKDKIGTDKYKLIRYLNEISIDKEICTIACKFISDVLLPEIKSNDLKFLIDLALIFKENNYIQGLNNIAKIALKFNIGEVNHVDYLQLTEVISNDNIFKEIIDKFHPNIYAQAIILYKQSNNYGKWLNKALSMGISSIDIEIIPAMLYSLATNCNIDMYSKQVDMILDYISNPEILNEISQLGQGVLVKVIYYKKSHKNIVTDVFDIICTKPDIETYRIGISCLQSSIHLDIPRNHIIKWLIKNSTLAKDHLPLVLKLLIKCNIRHVDDTYDLTPISNAIDVALELDNDINRIEKLKQLAKKLNIPESNPIPETLE